MKKLSSYSLPWPADWAALFGAERPLVLEIGFGYGHMLQYLHKTRPEANIIGIEISNECMVKAETAIHRKHMDNVRVIHSRAETALYHLVEPESLREIHINFPDPWFKDRHAGRRLMQADTLDAMVSRLEPDGMLYLATDIIAYAEMSDELLSNTPTLTNTLKSAWVNEWADRVTTKYEKKARQQGRQCYYFAYQRNAIPAPAIPVMKELDMPHMVIKTPLNLQEMLEQVHFTDYSENDTSIKIAHQYRGENALLFDAYVHEPTIEQRVGIVVVTREEPDEYTIKLSLIGNPRPTDGLHLAVSLIGQTLVTLHQDAEILQNKVRIGI